MDGGPDPAAVEMALQGRPILGLDHVKVVGMMATRKLGELASRRFGDRVGVARRDISTAFVPDVQVRKLRPEHGGLHLVQPAVDALRDVDVALGLAVLAH